METILESDAKFASRTDEETNASLADPGYQAYTALRLGFTVAPIIAGADKFFNVLTDWGQYLPAFVDNMVGGNGHALMLAVGVIEIAAGIGVLVKPKIFGYVVAIWLIAIIVNLLMIPGYFDVALRDLGLAIGAFALARLAAKYEG